ncbi:uncharacterized protein N7469_006262 [Penicillium citrinum]|uniref:Uncharacterized protein n=1 Tax=Penicillium citrinum TaxID=5077 RepID=A0A9W9NXP2_PENCI|nr:uncharacterized protein N7469_006262 [Penicillium citrinum]KAJ5231674.1 hypothetical protein N7469_006262 [Penicillium citrinum]
MSPIPRGDLDMDNQSSDVGDSQDSPLRRQFSEPFRPQSTSTQISQSPEPFAQRVKCEWCGKLLEVPEDGSISKDNLLNSHHATHHPDLNEIDYDGPEDGMEEDVEEAEDDDVDEVVEDGLEDGLEDGNVDEDEEGDDQNGELEFNEDGINGIVQPGEDEVDVGEQEEEPLQTAPPSPTDQQRGSSGPSDAENTTAKTSDTNVKVGPVAQTKFDLLEFLSNPKSAYPDGFRQCLSEWQASEMTDRLPKIWTVNDVKNFCPTYEQDTSKLEDAWQQVFRDAKPKKRDAPEPIAHPTPYKTTEVEPGKFLDINSPEGLLAMLQKPELLTPEELYLVAEAASFMMKTWQDEYIALDKLYLFAHRHYRTALSGDAKRDFLTGHKKRSGYPLARVPENPIDFEEKKEAMLYGYKHQYFPVNTSAAASRIQQNPFAQGGFVPTPAQARKMIARVPPEERNPDGWNAVVTHGVEFVPKLWEPRKEPTVKLTRKRKAVEVEASKSDTEETRENTQDAEETEEEAHPTKRRTRGRGGRRTTFEVFQPETPVTASSRGRGGRGRGRGRGRGGVGRPSASRQSLDAMQTPPTFTPTSTRGRGKRGASSLATSSPQTSHSHTTVTEEVPPPLATISPMPESTPPAKLTPTVKRDATAEELEEARRQKIMNSKNPKRTKAMLDHWERFNREGRIRNPKRSKAQIEQDRTDDDARKVKEPPRPSGRRKRSPSIAQIPAGNLAPKAPHPLGPMPGAQHLGPVPGPPPGPTLPSLGLPHYVAPNPFNAPPVGLGQPMPTHAQYAPFPWVPYQGHLPGHPPPPDHHRR